MKYYTYFTFNLYSLHESIHLENENEAKTLSSTSSLRSEKK